MSQCRPSGASLLSGPWAWFSFQQIPVRSLNQQAHSQTWHDVLFFCRVQFSAQVLRTRANSQQIVYFPTTKFFRCVPQSSDKKQVNKCCWKGSEDDDECDSEARNNIGGLSSCVTNFQVFWLCQTIAQLKHHTLREKKEIINSEIITQRGVSTEVLSLKLTSKLDSVGSSINSTQLQNQRWFRSLAKRKKSSNTALLLPFWNQHGEVRLGDLSRAVRWKRFSGNLLQLGCLAVTDHLSWQHALQHHRQHSQHLEIK